MFVFRVRAYLGHQYQTGGSRDTQRETNLYLLMLSWFMSVKQVRLGSVLKKIEFDKSFLLFATPPQPIIMTLLWQPKAQPIGLKN